MISSFSLKSPYRIIIDRFVEGAFRLCVSTEILLEYEEKLKERYDHYTAEFFLDALAVAPNVERIEPFFRLQLIYPDLDDNKFVDPQEPPHTTRPERVISLWEGTKF